MVSSSLFENLAIGVNVLLAVDGDGLVPGPLSLDVGTVLGLGGVELGKLVALIVGSNVEDREVFLATDNEGTLDDRVVVDSVDGATTEEVLARTLKTVVEATDEVVRHESHGQLIVVLVGNLPQRVLLEVDVLPEPLEGNRGLVVGVLALPFIEGKRGLGQGFKGVLGLGGSRLLLLLSSRLGGGSGLGGGGRLGLLNLLGSGVGQNRRLQDRKLLNDGSVDGLVDNGLVPTGNGGVLLAPLLVEEELEASVEEASAENISEGDALTNKVGVVGKVLFNRIDVTTNLLEEIIDGLLVVGDSTSQLLDRTADMRGDFIEEGHPFQDGSVVLLGLA